MSGPSPVLGLHHLAIQVQDVAAAERFYVAAASLQPWPAAQPLSDVAGARWLSAANAGLCLLPAAPGASPVRRGVNEAGITHWCLQTPDISAVHRRFADAGAAFHCAPVDLGTGFLYCYARDPEFNVTEIECVPPVWADSKPWVAHVNIATADLSRLAAFYAAFLGSPAVRSPRLHSDSRLDAIADLPQVQLRAAWLQAHNVQIELMQYSQPATTLASGRRVAGEPGFAAMVFEVDSLLAAVAHLRHCGGSAVDATAGTNVAQCSDPDGNRLTLLHLQSPAARAASFQQLPEPFITHRFETARSALKLPS